MVGLQYHDNNTWHASPHVMHILYYYDIRLVIELLNKRQTQTDMRNDIRIIIL